MPPVTIRVLSDEPSPQPIAGVVIEFYSTAAVFQTGGTSDVAGEVTVTLPEADYDVMLYKVGVTILPKQPQRITVDDALSNIFEVAGHIRVRPESVDPLRCTVSGNILGVDGLQAKHRLIFEPKKVLASLSGNIIALYSRREVASDEEGYFEFELLRNTKYTAYFLFPQDLFCEQPGKLDIVVPDQPSVALDVLLFPLPIDVDFSTNAISLVAGDPTDETTEVEIGFSDGSVRETTSTPWGYISVTNTDATVVEASISDGQVLCLKPLAAGTATITTVRVISEKATFDPLPDFVTESVVVTVT